MFDFYSLMLSIRKKVIIPVIKKIKTKKFEIYTDKSFSVNWNIEQEGKKILSVIANFEDTSIDINSFINEKDIIAISKPDAKNEIVSNKTLPAQSVLWILN